jgi:putative oxidoreductase
VRAAVIIARTLLGLIFLVFGLNGFLHFLPNPPMPGPAGAFAGALFATGYMIQLISAFQVIAGILLLTGMMVPLALAILAPILLNIIFFHLYLAPAGFPPGLVATVLELFLVWRYRAYFAPLFASPPA